jgi:hypothetical protein
MYLGVKELIEVKSEISLGVSYWDAASTKLAISSSNGRIASVVFAGWPNFRINVARLDVPEDSLPELTLTARSNDLTSHGGCIQ